MQPKGQEESSLAEPMAGMGCVENCGPGAQGQGAKDGCGLLSGWALRLFRGKSLVDLMTPDLVFRDPYLLDFLGLEDTYSERDLEAAILRELERFLLELGTDFSFIARQKRMTIGDRDFYLDLLFYHRSLRRLVAIELKLGSFDAAYKGQMELYLRWLDKYERRIGEEPPIGLILCGEKNREQIELLQLDRGEIWVAEYLVELPPREMLEAKLQEAIRLARGQIEGAREEKP